MWNTSSLVFAPSDLVRPLATTDAVSNVVELAPDSPLGGQAMSGFMRGELCQSYLSRFLHEGAHHSCFDTRLGAALASVELHARQLGFTKTGCSHGSLDNATRGAGVGCHNRAVFNAALELLSPIREVDSSRPGRPFEARSCGRRPLGTWMDTS